uniref:Fucosyltransferase n=1 Tax=Leptobrachium leishanense TaxID=445787 RepID=A0A8C5PH78_9ANUR
MQDTEAGRRVGMQDEETAAPKEKEKKTSREATLKKKEFVTVMEPIQQTSQTKKLLFFFLLQAMLLMLFFTSFKLNTNDNEKVSTSRNVTDAPDEPVKIILLWTWPFGFRFPLNQCPPPLNKGCFFTANRSLYSSADAVVLHHRDVCNSREQLPNIPRPKKQYWIWFNLESPSHCPNLNLMDNLINLTMSYRVDSDIFTPYGRLLNNDGSKNFTIPEKTNLSAWAISNWNPQSRRVQYYEDLKNYLPIDVYGRLHKPLPNDNLLDTLSTYKFYLAFENSIHQDYITEKLWVNAITSGAVPVVMGPPRENYERFIPPESFIHVDDFSTAQELAAYLLELDKDDKRYQEYFNWRSSLDPAPEIPWVPHYCKICRALKEAPPYQTIPSIAKWFK